jgi:hypothetical protein
LVVARFATLLSFFVTLDNVFLCTYAAAASSADSFERDLKSHISVDFGLVERKGMVFGGKWL